MIRLKNINVVLDGKKILQNIDLTIQDKEILVIIGSSGSGKSTLLRLIIGLLQPSSGEIWVNDCEISKISEDDLNKIRLGMGMVFQYSALFDSMSVGENVAFSLRQHTKLPDQKIKEIVKEKLGLVDLRGIEAAMPKSLSGGMKKRVSLARAIANNPHIVLYDEPTSGLDPINSRIIDQLILNTRQAIGATAIIVTHDIESAFTIADRIVMLDAGCIIAAGTVAEIKKSTDPLVAKFINYSTLSTKLRSPGKED
ncbi:MAG: ABC transporter ATP-binding protein [Sporomusaceae bacterium]|jgi:phospholipid/cholesterol/gamma-HCH transport system ATP-binding protein|nr:ABC transporter ATP-binding protein [Sporomusaceae bacterium]